MPLRAPAKRRRAVSVTSLIDVIFLLLLFFMLTSTFTKFAEVPLVSGGTTASAAVPAQDVPPLFLRLEAESVTVNGEELDDAALREHVAALVEGETVLLVSIADDAVSSQRLVDVLTLLHGLPDLAVSVLE